MRQLIKKLLLLLMLVYPLTGVAQTEVISEKYKLIFKAYRDAIGKKPLLYDKTTGENIFPLVVFSSVIRLPCGCSNCGRKNARSYSA